MDGMETIISERAGETCYRFDHPSGLPVYVWPKPGYKSAYAVFAAKYGSIDTAFTSRVDGKETSTEVPAGIAHYLEHKLFENEDCDAFERYAQTGASANAYTSFNQTSRRSFSTAATTPFITCITWCWWWRETSRPSRCAGWRTKPCGPRRTGISSARW